MITGLVMALTVAGATIAIFQRNIVRAIMGLALSLAGVALAFLLLGSPFVAVMEVLIYIGGITVAMAFAVMFSSVGRGDPVESGGRSIAAAAVAILFFAGVASVIIGTDFGPKPETTVEAWSVERIGFDLLDRFNVVFEVLSVVLLLSILGAVTIAKRYEEEKA